MRGGSPQILLTATAVCAALLGGPGRSAAGDWHRDFQTGLAQAQQADKPLLVHFSASWCGPCQEMEPVLHSRTVRDLLRTDAVGVHLDFDRSKAVAQQLGVRGIPADVLLAPDGRVLGQMSGLKQAGDYARRVRAVAGQYVSLRSRVRPKAPVTAPTPVRAAPPASRDVLPDRLAGRFGDGPVPRAAFQDPSYQDRLRAPEEPAAVRLAPADPTPPIGGAFGDSNPAAAAPPADTFGGLGDPFKNPTPGSSPANEASPAADPAPLLGTPRVARRPSRKLLGMRGFCPVTLHEKREWVRGNHDFQWEHQGITYFLADDAAFDKFWANSERYAPKLLGCDPVLYRDTQRAVPGDTRYAAIWRDDLFLFKTAENRTKFRTDPSRYANGRQVLLIDELEGMGTY